MAAAISKKIVANPWNKISKTVLGKMVADAMEMKHEKRRSADPMRQVVAMSRKNSSGTNM